MASNPIPFQQGLSMRESFQRLASEAQCAAALEALRWPGGSCCRRCGKAAHRLLCGGSGKALQCHAFRHQALPIAGTVLQGSQLPLTVCLLTIDLIRDRCRLRSSAARRRRPRTQGAARIQPVPDGPGPSRGQPFRFRPRASLPQVWRSAPRGLRLPIQPPIRAQPFERAAPDRGGSPLPAAPKPDPRC